VRLGVTGLSRSGKTVFITALVHNLLSGGRLPLFNAYAQGRIARAYLEPQLHDELPRFAYEEHVQSLIGDNRRWPDSTRRLSELRLTIEYAAHGVIARNTHGGTIHIDIVDYPGEWLLDLPLMTMTFEAWSHATVAQSRLAPRAAIAGEWHEHLVTLDPNAPASELAAQEAARLFTAYLARCRADAVSMSSLPPGRFLMPGDLDGSPLLTFAPLDVTPDASAPRGSLHAMMRRRYDSYVAHVVRPFFYGHFARLDRQIVLADVLTALNAGPSAVADLSAALTSVLSCFRQGENSWASSLFGRKIDRILFAATKADLLHHTSHDRLEAILRLIVEGAVKRAEYSGAAVDVAAIAAIRATREASVKQGGETLPCIVGVPQAGETIGDEIFDGRTEAAIFPGDLPEDPARALDGSLEGAIRFVRFRPPLIEAKPPLVQSPSFPHIRLDRTIEFLFGDKFK
jgi:predicted YcjX-like family ATPase